jgi:uncharacterized protein YraI
MNLTCGPFRVMRLSLAAIALMLAGAWVPAQAFTASIVAHVHLRAGPSIEYPGVVMLPPGAAVEVYGCEQGYGWCDVQVGPDRGWVAASYLQMPSPSGPVLLASGGVVLGIPVVSFVFDTYWGNYYRGRPWYSRRAYYHNYWNRYPHGRPPPPRPPVVRPPVRPPPPSHVRPPHPRPPPGPRPPPAGGKPPPGGGKPPGGGGKPGGGRPPPGNGSPGNGNGRPPPGTRPAPGPGQ